MPKKKPRKIVATQAMLDNCIDLANKTMAACHLCVLSLKDGKKAEAEAMAFRALLLLSLDAGAIDKPRRHD